MKNFHFLSHGVRCAAWHVPAQTDALTGVDGRPCVVLAHGFSGTRDTGLLGFAEPFAAVGIDVLVFDYRGFGTSEGRLRQQISIARQLDDYRAAVDTAVRQPGVDPDRVVLIDDLIATGGTMMAGKRLLEKLGASVIEGAAIVDLPELGGSARLRESGLPLFTLVNFAGH